MEGKRFCNEDTGFVTCGNITKYVPKFNGNNVDAKPSGRFSGLVLPDLR